MIVYRAVNKVNGKSYVGQTTKTLKERRKEHHFFSSRGSSNYFHNALRKYGEDAFEWFVLEVLSPDATRDTLNDVEKLYIKSYNTFNSGYNLTTGGGSYEISDRTKKKMSEVRMGEKNHFYGKTHTKESRRKISEALSGRKYSGEVLEKKRAVLQKIREESEWVNPWSKKKKEDRHHTEETKRKMSEARKGERHHFFGKKLSEEHKQKIGEAGQGRYPSEETKQKMSEARKGHNVTCPHCGKVGGISQMKRWHFDNCGKEFKQKVVTCPVCGKVGGESTMKQWHFENCGKREILVCPHCGKEGVGLTMKRWHFDNCRYRDGGVDAK